MSKILHVCPVCGWKNHGKKAIVCGARKCVDYDGIPTSLIVEKSPKVCSVRVGGKKKQKMRKVHFLGSR